MKTLRKYVVNGGLFAGDGKTPAAVGDQVRLYLDTEAHADFPEFIVGTIQHPVAPILAGTAISYSFEYDEADLLDVVANLIVADVISVVVYSAVDVVAEEVDALTAELAGKQPLDSDLTAYANAADAAARRELLGVTAELAGKQPLDSDLTAYANAADAAARRELLGVTAELAGKQPLDSDLTAYANAADAAARRALIGAGVPSEWSAFGGGASADFTLTDIYNNKLVEVNGNRIMTVPDASTMPGYKTIVSALTGTITLAGEQVNIGNSATPLSGITPTTGAVEIWTAGNVWLASFLKDQTPPVTTQSVLALLASSDLGASTLSIDNKSTSIRQKIILWGSSGNEIIRVIPEAFVVDASVVAYLSAVETAFGNYVSASQFIALNNFVQSEKASGRWSLHKRIFLPIWANSAANAVDLVTATSGTWEQNGNMLHGNGFVKNVGSGPTAGRFNVGQSPVTLGITNATNYVVTVLLKTATASAFGFVYDSVISGSSELGFQFNGANTIAVGAPNINAGAIVRTGVFAYGRDAGVAYFKRRTTAANLTSTAASTTYIPSSSNIRVTGISNESGFNEYAIEAEIGLYSFSLGMSQANADAFTLNLKTLWETCTGLVLP